MSQGDGKGLSDVPSRQQQQCTSVRGAGGEVEEGSLLGDRPGTPALTFSEVHRAQDAVSQYLIGSERALLQLQTAAVVCMYHRSAGHVLSTGLTALGSVVALFSPRNRKAGA